MESLHKLPIPQLSTSKVKVEPLSPISFIPLLIINVSQSGSEV